jgi:hypothetical protein
MFPDPHFRPKDPQRWQRLVEHLLCNPDGFAIALENLQRWEDWGRVHPGPHHEYPAKIKTAFEDPDQMTAFLDWQAADNEDSEVLKGCAPFVGVLDKPPCSDKLE